jgi:hypothetical protein
MADLQKIFIISKEPSKARGALRSLLEGMGGSTIITVGDIQAEMSGTPYTSDIVTAGVQQAQAIIAICEPDEQAALYVPTLESRALWPAQQPRWQPRQNVLYEIGLAHARDRNKIIICSLGPDVILPSDLGGILIPRLDLREGLLTLHSWLCDRMQFRKPLTSSGAERWRKKFDALIQFRWSHHDEVYLVARKLQACRLGERSEGPTVLDALKKVLSARTIDSWKHSRPVDLMKIADEQLGPYNTDEFFWWLVIHGVFRFTDLEVWWEKEEIWHDAMWQTELSERAFVLFERLAEGD